MTLHDRLRQIASALPDDAGIFLNRTDLLALLEEDGTPATPARDLTVKEVAEETLCATSTVRGWLISGALRGSYKLNGRSWRIPRSALRDYLTAQTETNDPPSEAVEVDIAAWRKVRGHGRHRT